MLLEFKQRRNRAESQNV